MPKAAQNFVSQDVSQLLVLPASYTAPKPNTSFSVGDTHGNAVVLARYLYDAGIINLEQTAYDELIKIYEVDSTLTHSRLTREQCDKFREIVQKGFADAIVPDNIYLRCFGDMVSDRGSNDILTLIILDELRKKLLNLKGTILISNHDKSLIANYLLGNLRPGQNLIIEVQPCSSLIRLKHLIDDGVIPYDEFDEMMKSAYLPALKLVDYVRTNDSIDIMAHAPITLSIINKAMLQLLPAEQHLNIYQSVDNVAAILDLLNNAFVTGLNDPTSLIYKAITDKPSPHNPLTAFIWTRLVELNKLIQTEKKSEYGVSFRHGHDGEPGETIINNISYVGYNSILGKTTPHQWGQAAVAHMSMSLIGNGEPDSQKMQNEAFNEVISAQMEPTAIVEIESHPEASTIPNAFSNANSQIDEDALVLFKATATVRLNHYIFFRSSVSGTEVGDKTWTKLASGRNLVRSMFNAPKLDVPQVAHARELKQAIHSMTATNVEEVWPQLRESLVDLAKKMPQSKQYTDIVASILNDFDRKNLSVKGPSPLRNQPS